MKNLSEVLAFLAIIIVSAPLVYWFAVELAK
jgi:hypothetical protein